MLCSSISESRNNMYRLYSKDKEYRRLVLTVLSFFELLSAFSSEVSDLLTDGSFTDG